MQTRAIISYQLDEQRTDDHTEKSHGLIEETPDDLMFWYTAASQSFHAN